MGLIKTLCKGDKVVWLIFVILCTISIIEVFSATSRLTYGTNNHWGPITRHCAYLAMGVGLLYWMHKVPYIWIRRLGIVLYPISAALLIYITVRGMVINGASRWIEVGPLTFQPSELAKLSIIIIVSIILTLHISTINNYSNAAREAGFRYKPFWLILGLTGFMALLIFRENISTAGLMCLVVYMMMYIGKMPGKLMLSLAAAGVLGIAIVLAVVLSKDSDEDKAGEKPATEAVEKEDDSFKLSNRSETGANRLLRFFKPEKVAPEDYNLDDNGQVAHANIAIASSNIIGCMPGNSVQRDYLAQAFSDFIFAIVIEELGLLGGAIVVFLYLLLLIRAGRIAKKCDKVFPSFLVMGLALMLVTQAMINMMVAVGLFPVTGQPLPLISRGGTATVMNCVYVGIILGVSYYNEKRDMQPTVTATAGETQNTEEK